MAHLLFCCGVAQQKLPAACMRTAGNLPDGDACPAWRLVVREHHNRGVEESREV